LIGAVNKIGSKFRAHTRFKKIKAENKLPKADTQIPKPSKKTVSFSVDDDYTPEHKPRPQQPNKFIRQLTKGAPSPKFNETPESDIDFGLGDEEKKKSLSDMIDWDEEEPVSALKVKQAQQVEDSKERRKIEN
jgi:hypothetical protein